MTGPDQRRLADYVINRRVELEYGSQEELAVAADVSAKTVNRLEGGTKVASATLGKIERALKWKPGSMRAILAGDEPTPLTTPDELDEFVRTQLRARHTIDERLFDLAYADEQLESAIRRINAEGERVKFRSSERPESA